MSTRCQRRARAKERFIRAESDKLIRQDARDKGKRADEVAAIVKRNRGRRMTDEERAWLGKGTSWRCEVNGHRIQEFGKFRPVPGMTDSETTRFRETCAAQYAARKDAFK